MPPQFPARLDERRLEEARNRLCEVFGVPALRDHQEKAGQNIMLGKTTLYDVPTGGGKTLAFWYPLFYHLAQGGDCQKVVLVVSPLNALMNSQVKDLADRGISAVALNSEGGDIEDLFEKDSSSHGRLKYRVIFVSPEMALTRRFHQQVLKDKGFRNNCIELVIDEAHCVTEWGDNFREEYAELSQLLARLPSGLPVLLASATMPPDVTQDIVFKLGLPLDCPRVAVSNAKLNVALSVRVMQHPQKTYADLLFLLPADPTSIIQELPQTLIYVNSRSEAEEIQDFLRRHCPLDVKPEAFIFYHRHIDSKDKLLIQEGLRSGSYRCVVATDALGMGMDFQNIKRVILWREPPSFLSLVQKIGRCVRQLSQCGEAIILVTKSAYTQHLLNLETDGKEVDVEDDVDGDIIQETVQIDRIEEIDREDPEANEDEEPMGTVLGRRKVGGKKGAISAVTARDRRYLSYFLATSKCRRIPWDDFFVNADKLLLFVQPPNARCCDNCQPHLFPTETVAIRYPYPSRARRAVKPSMELQNAVRSALHQWRATTVQKHYAGQSIITGRYILSDDVINRIVERPRAITDVNVFRYVIPWGLGVANPSYAEEVVQAIHEQVALHPDPIQLAREEAAQEQANKKLEATAEKERYERLRQVFQGCYDAVYGETTGVIVSKGRGENRRSEPERKCQPFLVLPRRNAWPIYYEIIRNPISMAHIRKMMEAGPSKGYGSLDEFVAAWRTLFSNARTFNEPGSQIYHYADELERVFDSRLVALMLEYGFSLFGSDLDIDNE